MKVNETSLGSIGTAAMAYVSHITNHPSLCKFFLEVGIFGVVLAIVASVVVGIAKKNKRRIKHVNK